jgi:transcriptional regulator with XRE-family HTH domain
MSTLLDVAGYSAPELRHDDVMPFIGPFNGRSATWIGTSDHFGVPTWIEVLHRPTTSWPISTASPASFLAEEVVRLRDQIIDASSLTRQEIASAIGVDRRSLSGFANGEIRPTPPRLESLRLLVKVAAYASARWGERARDVLLSPHDGLTPLERVAAGDQTVFASLETAGTVGPPVKVERRLPRTVPLYEMVRTVAKPTTRLGTLRDENVYSQDLSEANAFHEEPITARRRRIK